jgi:hypothetical protein
LQNHKEEILLFLKQNYIDILLISETHCTNRSYFSIPRSKLCYTNHPDGTAHGSTVILIKETIVYYELIKYEEDFIQATSVKVKGFPHEIKISAVYCPPRHNLIKEHTLWGSRLTTTTTTKGRELSKVLQGKNYSFL